MIWSFVVKETHAHAEHARKLEQPACANSVDALFVLLHLLKGKSELLTQTLLAHPEEHAPKSHPAADVDIDGIRSSGALFFVARLAHKRSFCSVVMNDYFYLSHKTEAVSYLSVRRASTGATGAQGKENASH